MYFCYPEIEPPYTGRPVPYTSWDATKRWLDHYSNYKFLEFVTKSRRSSFQERQQASREIAKCQEKMDRMARHPNFDLGVVTRERERIDEIWRSAISSAHES